MRYKILKLSVIPIFLFILILASIRFTGGNPQKFYNNFFKAANISDSHHTKIESVDKFSWLVLKDPTQIPRKTKVDFDFITKQPESFLLIIEGKITTYGGYYSGNNDEPKSWTNKGVRFGLVPLDSDGGMSWGAKSVDYNKLKELGEVHTLPYPIGKIAWYLLYETRGMYYRYFK